MNYFSVPSISILYSLEDYGESIFGSTSSLATAASEPDRIRGVAIAHQSEAPTSGRVRNTWGLGVSLNLEEGEKLTLPQKESGKRSLAKK